METLSEPLVQTIEIIMPGESGFHLRVAAQFVECMREFHSDIRIRKGEVFADGKSIMELLVLGAACKSKLEIEVVGDDAVLAIERIKEFFLNQENTSENLW